MGIKTFDSCPSTDTSLPLIGNNFTNDITYSTTANMKFPGGWKPSDDKALNPYGGTYSYSQLPTGDYVLEVVPNFSGLTWVGTAPFCGGVVNDCTTGFTDPKFNVYPYRPAQWAGYVSTGEKDNTPYLTDNHVHTPALGCNSCLTGQKVLCSNNTFMDDSSCPGNEVFTDRPYTNNTETNYYNQPGKEAALYPRGVGKCYYPKDIIATDDDLYNLALLKAGKKIHPDLADELAIHYCYETDATGRTCGKDANGNAITKCTRFKADANSENSSQKPCVAWMNYLVGNNKQLEKVDAKSREWCQRAENKDTPLCDCLQRDSCISATGMCPSTARSFYKTMTTEHNNVITSATPPECWYKPCYRDLSYAIPLEQHGPGCTAYANICNQINNMGDSATMSNNQQYLNCTIDAKTGESTSNTDTTTTPAVPAKKSGTTAVVVVLAVVALVVVGIFVVPMFTSVAAATAITSTSVSAVAPALTGVAA